MQGSVGVQIQVVCCRLDIPKAPLLLGNLLGQAVSEKLADGAALQQLCEPIEDTEARRELLSSTLKFIQVMHLQLFEVMPFTALACC